MLTNLDSKLKGFFMPKVPKCDSNKAKKTMRRCIKLTQECPSSAICTFSFRFPVFGGFLGFKKPENQEPGNLERVPKSFKKIFNNYCSISTDCSGHASQVSVNITENKLIIVSKMQKKNPSTILQAPCIHPSK